MSHIPDHGSTQRPRPGRTHCTTVPRRTHGARWRRTRPSGAGSPLRRPKPLATIVGRDFSEARLALDATLAPKQSVLSRTRYHIAREHGHVVSCPPVWTAHAPHHTPFHSTPLHHTPKEKRKKRESSTPFQPSSSLTRMIKAGFLRVLRELGSTARGETKSQLYTGGGQPEETRIRGCPHAALGNSKAFAHRTRRDKTGINRRTTSGATERVRHEHKAAGRLSTLAHDRLELGLMRGRPPPPPQYPHASPAFHHHPRHVSRPRPETVMWRGGTGPTTSANQIARKNEATSQQ